MSEATLWMQALLLPLVVLEVSGATLAVVMLRASFLSWLLGWPCWGGLVLATLLAWKSRPLETWLRLEGALAAGLLLLSSGRTGLIWTALVTGLPVLAAAWGRSRMVGKPLLVVWVWTWVLAAWALPPSSAVPGQWVGALVLVWWAVTPRRGYLDPGFRTPLAAAMLLETLPAPLLARLRRPHELPWPQGNLVATATALARTRQIFQYRLQLEYFESQTQNCPDKVVPLLEKWHASRPDDLAALVTAGLSATWLARLKKDTLEKLTLRLSKMPVGLAEKRCLAIVGDFVQDMGVVRPPTSLEEAILRDPELVNRVISHHFNESGQRRQNAWRPRLRRLGQILIGLALLTPFWLWLPRLARERLSTRHQLQSVLDRLLGSERSRAHLVVREGRPYCTIVCSDAPPAGLEQAVVGLLGPEAQVTVVRHAFPAGPNYWPPLGLLAIAGLAVFWRRRDRRRQALAAPQAAVKPDHENACCKRAEPRRPDPLEFQVDPLSVEVGRGLLGLVDPNQGARLLERVTSLRRYFGELTGVVLPGVRFRDNLKLAPPEYLIRVRGLEVCRGEVVMNCFLAQGEGAEQLKGTVTAAGTWIAPELREQAEALGCRLTDPTSVVADDLREVVRRVLPDLFGVQQTQTLLNEVALQNPALVGAAVPARLSLAALSQVLRELLRRGGNLKDMVAILEYCLWHPHESDPVELAKSILAELPSVGPARNSI